MTAGHDLTVLKQYLAGEVSWPVRVGAIPALADCYQPRGESELLHSAVGAGGTAVLTQVLSGLGGVGKSQLATAYARAAATEVDVLVWVSATTRSAILSTYSQASIQLGLATDGDPTQAASRFLSWLQTTEKAWLVVLDDLADPADLRGLWPDTSTFRGRTLVTTRRSDPSLITHGRRRVEVGSFSPAEARGYLTTKLAGTDLSQADELAADVGYLPLALAQAGSFILNQGETCAEYRTRLADRRRRLARVFPDSAPADEYRATVAATWSISIEAADKLDPRGLAAPLLRMLSMLDPNGIPTDILTTRAITGLLNTTCTSETGTVNGRDCQDAARNLARLSLLTPTQPGPGESSRSSRIRVHALVQRAATEHLTPEQIAPLVAATGDALIEIWPEIECDPHTGRVLRANAAALADQHLEMLWKPERHPLLWRAGRSLSDGGLVNAAVAYWTRLARSANQLLGPGCSDTLATRANLEWARHGSGEQVGAAARTETLLADYVRVLGPDHIDTLNFRANAAYWRGEAGDPAGAMSAYKALLEDCLRVLGPNHPQTLNDRANLARWQGEAGDLERAGNAYKALLEDCLRVLGPNHPQTLTVRAGFAYYRGEAGEPAGAVSAYKALLDDYLRVLGPNHPETLTARANLARWLGEAGDPAMAATETELVLLDRVRVLGPDHPETLTARANLARWQGEAGKPVEAVAALEVLVSDWLRVLGPDHPLTLSARHSLAFWRGEAGEPGTAATSAAGLLVDCLRVLGPDHPLTMAAKANLTVWRRKVQGSP